jgi:hypothetical protein
LLAPARTTTQPRDTDRTHRFVWRVAVGAFATDLAGCGLGSAAATGGAASAGVGSGASVSELATTGCEDWGRDGVGLIVVATTGGEGSVVVGAPPVGSGLVSPAALVFRGKYTVSTLPGDEATFGAGALRARSGSRGPLSCKSQAVPTIPTALTTATPRSTCGQIGGRSGFVPHHRHEPTVSG